MFRTHHLRSCLLTTGLVATVFGVGSGTASAHNDHPEIEAHPYHAAITLTGRLDFNQPSVSLSGTGRAPYMGRKATTVQTITRTGDNTAVVTSAKGEVLRVTFVAPLDVAGIVCPAGADPVKSTWAFTGGTGRFSQASGAVTVAGCSTNAYVSDNVYDTTTVVHVDGTIYFADDSGEHRH
jgi:hypothetical protein